MAIEDNFYIYVKVNVETPGFGIRAVPVKTESLEPL